MKIIVHVHLHPPVNETGILSAIHQLEELIMTGQAEAAQTLATVAASLDKIAAESAALLEEVATRKALLEQQVGDLSPELAAAIANVSAKAQAIDDLVPDAAPPAPV